MPNLTKRLRCIALFCSVVGVGCAQHSDIGKRSVADLYQDAVNSSARRVNTSPGLGRSDVRGFSHQKSSGGLFGQGGLAESDHEQNSMLEVSPLESEGESLTRPVHAGEPDSTFESIEGVEFNLNDVTLNAATPIKLASKLTPAPPLSANPTQDQTLITDSFQDTELREAIQILAEWTGDQVIIDEAVGGLVTAEITEATLAEALQQVVMQHGYIVAKHNGAYIIAPPTPDSPLFEYIAERRQYHAISHTPSKLVELLPDRYRDYYQISDERNLIVIDAPPKIAGDIERRLQELDQPVQQVELEAIVCVTLPDSGFRFGMDWNHILKLDSADQLNIGVSGLAISAAGSSYGVTNAFDDFAVTSAFVQALSQEGYVSIRAQPRVTAKDGQKASISIARETFFSLQPNNSSVLFRQDVQKVDAGISLDITPRVRGDIISVSIERAEVSEDIRSNSSNPELTNNPYPIINRRLVSTEVDVRDGHTIVIGGLVQRQTVDRVNKVPVLGSIPLLGRMFQTIEKQEQDAEVAIFISPRLVPFD